MRSMTYCDRFQDEPQFQGPFNELRSRCAEGLTRVLGPYTSNSKTRRPCGTPRNYGSWHDGHLNKGVATAADRTMKGYRPKHAFASAFSDLMVEGGRFRFALVSMIENPRIGDALCVRRDSLHAAANSRFNIWTILGATD